MPDAPTVEKQYFINTGETLQNRIAQPEDWPTRYTRSIITDAAPIFCGQNSIDTQGLTPYTLTAKKRCLETFEKWLRRVSKFFSAKRTSSRDHDILQAVNTLPGKAENI